MPQTSFLSCNVYMRNTEIHHVLYMSCLLYLACIVLFRDCTMETVNSIQPTGPETGNLPLHQAVARFEKTFAKLSRLLNKTTRIP